MTDTPRKIVAAILILLVAGLCVLPWYGAIFDSRFPTSFDLRIYTRIMIFAIVVIGLNILVGAAGLVSLGHAALYGFGAHVAALLALRADVGFLPGVIGSVALTAAMGAVLAYPSVRVRGVFLAVITVAFGLVFVNVLREWVPVTGGASGLSSIPRGEFLGLPLTLRPNAWYALYYVVLFCLVLSFLLQYTILRSYLGRAMRASAMSENAARALGISIIRTRTIAFMISAGFAGLAGALFTNLALFVNYESFRFTQSVEFLLMAILGGAGTLLGPLVGTVTVFYSSVLLQAFEQWQTFFYGLMLLLVLFAMPKGVVGSIEGWLVHRQNRGRTPASSNWPHWTPELDGVVRPPAAGQKETLRLEGLTLRFGGLVAVDSVDLVATTGTVHALIGPNGAGKSSVINMISGFYRPSAGKIRLAGQDVTGVASTAMAAAGVARTFQNTELFGAMSALENVMVGFHGSFSCGVLAAAARTPAARRQEAAARAQAKALLDFVGLTEFADVAASSLPFGHQRRLEIARALALRPRLLLLDEPAAGLTHGEIEDLVRLIQVLAQRHLTILLVEHHVDMIMAVSDHVTVLDYGQVIASGRPAEIRENPRVIEAYFGHATKPTPHQEAVQ
ncbi:MAG: branched-chain amino acid ABC transporter ATP-binding protein/permease [Methylobacterium sp.]|jgi:ABC-type branched-subunit amino acid transport system ATPase component/ABC-type branched-subunit amino acid transport system permease subunit|nr:branched-chain amino acid ABC transporter ATP-binding protein/permease [Methylobacterium sp.]MCA3619862.1 branched-chain amino acid ABC transporter ATP-binding protein/permease [Methylobacterium sp.]